MSAGTGAARRGRREWTRAQLIDLFGSVNLFARLPAPQREAIAVTAEPRIVRRGTVVVSQGEVADVLYVVASGSLLVQRSTRNGERRAVNVIEAPGSFGELSLLDSRPRSASVEALETCELFEVSRESFLSLLTRDPRLVDGVLRELGRMVRRLTDQVADDALLDLPTRVAKTVLRLVDAQVAADEKAEPVVTLAQSKLAELAGGSRQSVNAALSALASRGLIRLDTRRIVVTDLAGLRSRAGVS
jgi:CRP/FNR family transcriptional regulator, cyclic AMP receptor protein